MRNLLSCTTDQIAVQWDELAHARFAQISSGEDISYNHVLVPEIFHLLDKSKLDKALDIGCGVGILSNELSHLSNHVTGIDCSGVSIKLARENFGSKNNLSFVHEKIETFAERERNCYESAVCNMFFMDSINLDLSLKAIRKILRPQGQMVFTICHPCYWPRYWNYENEPWFNYHKETYIEADFTISLSRGSIGKSVHVHRPLQMYIELLQMNGFFIKELREPMPEEEVMRKYPRPWEYPRFLVVSCGPVTSYEDTEIPRQ